MSHLTYKRCFVFIGLVTASLFCFKLVSHQHMRNAAMAELHDRLHDLTLAGLPTDEQTLHSYHRQLTSGVRPKNWNKILAVIQAKEFREKIAHLPFLGRYDNGIYLSISEDWPPISEPWDKNLGVDDFLKSHDALYDDIYSLADCPTPFYLQYNWEDKRQTDLPMAELVSRLLFLRHQHSLRINNFDDNYQAIRTLFALANGFQAQPSIHSSEVNDIQFVACEALRQRIAEKELSDEELQDIAIQLKDFEILRYYRESLNSEFVTGHLRARNIDQWSLLSRSTEFNWWHRMTRISEVDSLAILDTVEDAKLINTKNPERFTADLEQALDRLGERLRKLDLLHTVAIRNVQPITPLFRSFILATYVNRIARIAVAIQIFEREHGHFPPRLEALIEANLLESTSLELPTEEEFTYIQEPQLATLSRPPTTSWRIQKSAYDEPYHRRLPNGEGKYFLSRIWKWKLPAHIETDEPTH